MVGISRTPEKLAALGVEARHGDFDQPDSLATAFAGLDRLLLIPTDNMMPGVRAKQATAAIDGAVAAGVRHVALMSALGTRSAKAPHLWESYFVPEQTLMSVVKSWSIIRTAYYAEALINEIKMSLARGVHASIAATPVNFVSRDDVAAAAAGLLSFDGHHGAIYQATGPEAVGGEARASLVAKVAGARFAFGQVTPEQFRQGLELAGLPPQIVDALLSIQNMWAVGGFDVTTGDVERLSGTRPCSLAEVMAASLP